jgi:hypothetical protein
MCVVQDFDVWKSGSIWVASFSQQFPGAFGIELE